MDKDRRDRKQQQQILEMLEREPIQALRIPQHLRRHLRTLEDAGKIACDDKTYKWHIVKEEVTPQ